MHPLEQVHAHLAANRLGEAAALLDTLPAHDPAVLQARAALAHQAGRPDEAVVLLQAAAAAVPGHPGPALALAQLLGTLGRHVEAEAHLRTLLAAQPGSIDAWYLLGMTRYARRDDVGALEAFTRAHALAPAHPDLQRALAEAHYALEQHAQALPLFDALPAAGADPMLLLRRAQCRRRMGAPGDARALALEATARHPTFAPLWQERGWIEEDLGDADAARAAYLRAQALDPRWADPVGCVIALDRGDAPAELVATADAMAADETIPPTQRAYLHHVLGKRDDARGDYAAAAAHWGRANALRRAVDGTFDRAAYRATIDALIASLDRDTLAALHATALPDERPVFVVGMPRSGTTLVEQVLAAHPAAWGCGERTGIVTIAQAAATATAGAWPRDAARLPQRFRDVEARAYLDEGARLAPHARRLVDKQPYNFLHVGLIAALFADARVVWCRRDPRDIALSIWSESFSPLSDFATDLADILFVVGEQERLMRHWQQVAPVPILSFTYEDVVEAPEAHFRALVDFAGLDWDPACLDFHASGRSVQTISRWQVRQPVHARSVGRWKRYAWLFEGLDAPA